MNALAVNPQSGFLDAANHNGFTSEKKLAVLELIKSAVAQKCWPSIASLVAQVGISPKTFYNHVDADPEFAEAYENAMAPVEDQLAQNLYEQGQNANGITANIFLLKTRWKKRWGDQNTIQIIDFTSLKGSGPDKSQAIEADIVENPAITSTQKPNNEPKRST